MGCKYVKEFDFSAKPAYCKGGPVMKAKGGAVKEKATGETYPSRRAMEKHESLETPRMRKEEMMSKVAVRAPARRSVPVAPTGPMITMKKGGSAKVEKVMGEYGAGKLHSGSKTGPVVKSRDQAVAIALSEARKARK